MYRVGINATVQDYLPIPKVIKKHTRDAKKAGNVLQNLLKKRVSYAA